jgi:hypothetical protein
MLEPLEYGKDKPHGGVWDIVFRWHRMRLIFAIYLDKAIKKAYVILKFLYTSGVDKPDTTEASASERDMPKPS